MSVRLAKSNDTPAPRNPVREALAAVIQSHAALTTALAENQALQQRAEDAWFTANRRADAATQAVEDAKQVDAEAIAEGRAIGAAKAARAALTDAEDQRDATKSARTMLTDQATDLSNRLSISSSRVNEAVAAVVRSDPATGELIDQFRAAQIKLHETREVMAVLMPLFPHASNNAAWEGSAWPVHARFWDSIDWERKLPPSQIAARVQEWLGRLRTDADAVLYLV
jgi:hypothetical protein